MPAAHVGPDLLLLQHLLLPLELLGMLLLQLLHLPLLPLHQQGYVSTCGATL